jgi:ribosomal protein S18 acetylase RimI-like enzyme
VDIELLPVRPLEAADEGWAIDLLIDVMSGPPIASRGVLYDGTELPGLVAEYEGSPAGLLLYDIADGEMHIVYLASTVEHVGVGTSLLDAAIALGHDEGCRRAWLVATNDNVKAFRFYQRRGWELVAVHLDSLAESRRLKPTIPFVGHEGIPIRHEIEFEVSITR